MKFSISQTALANAVAIVSKAVASNAAIPVLGGILIKAHHGTLELQTTNLNESVRHRVAANVEEPGDTVIPFKVFSNIVKTLPDSPVTITSNGEHATKIEVKCAKSHFALKALSPDDFPEFPVCEREHSLTVEHDKLARLCDMTVKFVSKDDSRPLLKSIHVDVETNSITFQATDSYRLSSVKLTGVGSEEPFVVNVPGHAIKDALSLPHSDGLILSTGQNQVVFEMGNTTYVTRKLEGNYPNVPRLIPSHFESETTVNPSALIPYVRRVAIVSGSNPAIKVELSMESDEITLSGKSTDFGESTDTISSEVVGGNVVVGLNPNYLVDMLTALNEFDQASMKLNSLEPSVVQVSDDNLEATMLIMPVRI